MASPDTGSADDSLLASATQSANEKTWPRTVNAHDDVTRIKADDSELDRLTTSVGSMALVDDSAVFIPATHWYTIISEIKEVKKWFEDYNVQFEDMKIQVKTNTPGDEPFRLTPTQKMPSKKPEVSSNLPPKPICDIIMARFFETGTLDPGYCKRPSELSY